jgi:hypothetical protein
MKSLPVSSCHCVPFQHQLRLEGLVLSAPRTGL